MTTTERTQWLTINELAAYFRQSRRTIHRWIDNGCPHHRPNGRALFDLEEVEAWVRSRCSTVAPAQESAA